MTGINIKVVGWFCYKDENQYNELLSIFTDAHTLPPTFSRWKQITEKGIQHEESKGVIIVRAYVDSAEQFITFCRHFRRGVNADGRKYFANFKAAEYIGCR
ncbi:hypothetical protein MOR33_002739 [Salmonella enterica]|nr:hypothetical protein [Salmonella enterica]EGL7477251.1 hypothetical protein [Salmonella enterica]EIZ2333806.1 hypothetical protein [Salmonella enterica]